MKRKAFALAFCLAHLLLLLGNGSSQSTISHEPGAATANLAEAPTPGTTATAAAPGSSGSSTATAANVTSTAATASNVTSTATASNVTSTAATASNVTSTAATASSNVTSTVTAPTASNVTSTVTAPTASNVTSTSRPTAGSEEILALRPWEVALIAVGSVAMALILATGLAASLKNCPCLRNLTTHPNEPHSPSHGLHTQGYRGPSVIGTGFRNPSPPAAMELTGRHCV